MGYSSLHEDFEPSRGTAGFMLLGTMLALSLAACSSTPESEFELVALPERGELVESVAFPGAWMTPLEPILNGDRDRAEAIEEASRNEIDQCMTDRGFPDYDYSVHVPRSDRFFGVLDVEIARVWAFRDPEDPFEGYIVDVTPMDMRDPANAGAPQRSDAEIAFSGSEESMTALATRDDGTVVTRYDPDACLNIARLEVQPHYFELYSLETQIAEIRLRAYFEVQDSAEYRVAFDEWSACVVSRGERAPLFPEGSGWVVSPPGEISEEEISEAVAHTECLHESGFLRERSRLQAEAEWRLIEENPGVVTEYVELWNETSGGVNL